MLLGDTTDTGAWKSFLVSNFIEHDGNKGEKQISYLNTLRLALMLMKNKLSTIVDEIIGMICNGF